MIEKVLKVNNIIYYIYVEGGLYKMTTKENFEARVQNEKVITKFEGFASCDAVIEYLKTYFNDIIIL